MITTERYNELKAKMHVFDTWLNTKRDPRSGWASYKPEDVPATVPKVSNDERSQVEVYEFCHNPPKTYFVYVRRLAVAPGVVSPTKVEVTTWTGQLLGKGKLGRQYECYGFGGSRSRRYPIRFRGVNGFVYSGIYYASAGDYARVKLVKHRRNLVD